MYLNGELGELVQNFFETFAALLTDRIRRKCYFFTEDNKRLEGLIYKARDEKKNNRSAIIFCHGYLAALNGRAKKYAWLAHYYGLKGFAFDFRGHGGSMGKRGYISKETMQQDIAAAVEYLKRKEDVKNISLFGSSMGATAALYYLANHDDIKSAVLFSPFTNVFSFANESQRAAVEHRYREYKETGIEKMIPSFSGSRGERWVQTEWPVSVYPNLLEIDGVKAAEKVSVPTLVIMGKYDHTAAAIRQLYENLKSSDKKLVEFEDRHDLSRFKKEVIKVMLDWFNKHKY